MEQDGSEPEDTQPWVVPPSELGEHTEEILPPLGEMAFSDSETVTDDAAAAASEVEPEPIPEDKQKLIDYVNSASPGRILIGDVIHSVYGVPMLDNEKFQEVRRWMSELHKAGMVRRDGNSYIKLGKKRRGSDKMISKPHSSLRQKPRSTRRKYY